MNNILTHNKLGIIIIATLVLGGSFYWFEFRPAHIKKVCSWEEKKYAAIPGLTQEEINQQKRDFENCLKTYPPPVKEISRIPDLPARYRMSESSEECSNFPGRRLERTPSMPLPERTEFVKTTEKEYQFCLRANGL